MIDAQLSNQWYIGTIGFGYDDWNGVFYPIGIRASGYLTYYSRNFNAVEIDSTFHATPKRENFSRWAAITPADFRFCLKAPKNVTHRPRLTDGNYTMAKFLVSARALGEKLGIILVQFPPSFRWEQEKELSSFLGELPADLQFAVEVRHQSWYTAEIGEAEPELAHILRDHGVCWVASDYPGLPRQIWPTAKFLYIRWIGQHGSYPHHTHERIDRTADLSDWHSLFEGMNWAGARYGFFNNDYAGFAPGTANRFKLIMGLPITPIQQPQQGRLF